MSHTFTRTATLFDEFASCFEDADLILLHKIYSSAREVYKGGVTGRTLFEKTKENFGGKVFYSEEVDGGFELMKGMLKGGDLFITMGAGDNWRLGKKLFEFYKNENENGSRP
jgi:UDP-N-acetylmuramate--alanine ligase